jgi:hypothetical protein
LVGDVFCFMGGLYENLISNVTYLKF